MNLPSPPRAEPLLDRRRFVGGVVVREKVHIEFGRDVAFDLAQQAEKLPSAVMGIATSNDRSRSSIERREQSERSMACKVVRAPLTLCPGRMGRSR